MYHAQAVEGENTSKARIADFNAQLVVQEAEADSRSKVSLQNAYAEINIAKTAAESRRLEAEEIVPKEIEKRKIEIAAMADAEKQKIDAHAKAASILAIKEAEAKGILQTLQAKADGYKMLVDACSTSQDAATMLMVEKLEEIVKLQTEAIKNIKIDKITVWDSAGKGESSTANFLSNMVKSLPPLHELAQMSGVKLPDYLGNLKDHKSDSLNTK